MVISKFPLIRFSRFFCCFSNSSLNISFISVFNRIPEIVTSAILNVRILNLFLNQWLNVNLAKSCTLLFVSKSKKLTLKSPASSIFFRFFKYIYIYIYDICYFVHVDLWLFWYFFEVLFLVNFRHSKPNIFRSGKPFHMKCSESVYKLLRSHFN